MTEVLWRPDEAWLRDAALTRFAAAAGHTGATYDELWRWSLGNLEDFWALASEFLEVRWRAEPSAVLGSRQMPGAEWFPGGRLSFAEHVLAGRDPGGVAIRFRSEADGDGAWTWADLSREASRIRQGLVDLGVDTGDRVAAYLPNIPQALAAFLATASLGAVWSAAAPEFGVDAVVSRFAQIEPTVLLAVDGYRYKGRAIDREQEAREIAARIGAPRIRFGLVDGGGWEPGFPGNPDLPLEFVDVAFDHPLWVLYSSGTTGPPKAIVHGHGGMLLELLKCAVLQLDLRANDRFAWYTTTGWVMWNIQLAPLLAGASVVLFDGHPGGPGDGALWDLAADTGVTVFGGSAAWFDAQRRAGTRPRHGRDLSALRVIASTGSPLPAECFDWVYTEFPARTWLVSISGGTDVVTPFLGLAPTVPVYRGELGPPALGVDLQAWSEDGRPLLDEVGEMVVAAPIPSMPLGLWGDADGDRLRASYFERFPGVWTHGDWLRLTPRGTGIITGRSDATINRGGVRIGTAEIYAALAAVPELLDAVAVDVPSPGTHGALVLFVVLDGELDGHLAGRIRAAIRRACSPRHVPDEILAVADLPRTSSGKKLEVPVKRLLMGADPDTVVSRGSLANPDAIDAVLTAARALIPTGESHES